MVMDMMIFLHIIISDEDKEEEEEDTTEIHETFLYHLIPGLRSLSQWINSALYGSKYIPR